MTITVAHKQLRWNRCCCSLLAFLCYIVLNTQNTSDDELQELKFLEEIFDEVQHQSKVKKNNGKDEKSEVTAVSNRNDKRGNELQISL